MSQYYFVLHSLHKVLPSTTSYYKTCTKYFPVLLRTTKLAQSTSQYSFVLQNMHYFVLQNLHKVRPSTTSYYKDRTKYFPVLLRTTELAQITSQYYFVLQSLHKVLPSTTSQYYFVLQSLHKVLPSTTSYYKTCTNHFVRHSLHKVLPSTTSYWKTCTNHFPVLLRTTKLAQSTSQYYFVLQNLHKVRPSTTSYYTACTKDFPVLLRTTKLAQSTSQYYFVLQSWHKVLPSTTSQNCFVLQSLHKVLPSTTSYYKTCTKYFPVLFGTTKLAASKSTISYEFSYDPTSKSTFRARLRSIFITCHKMPRLRRNLHLVTTLRSAGNAICRKHATRHVESALPSTTSYYTACTNHFPVLLRTTKLAQSISVLLRTTKLAQSTSQYYFVLQSLHKVSQYYFVLQSLHKVLPSTTSYYKTCTKYFPVLLGITKLAASKSTISYEFSYDTTSKSTFRARLRSIFITCHKMPRLRRNLHLVTLCAALTMRFAENTQHDTSKVLFPVLLRTTQLAQSISVRLRTTKLAQSTSQYYFVLQNLHKVLPSTTWYHKTCSFKIDVFLRVFLRPDLKIDVSCEASVDFHHMSQNATPATEFAPCNTLRSADNAICRKHATRHVESAAPATKNAEGYLRNAALATTK